MSHPSILEIKTTLDEKRQEFQCNLLSYTHDEAVLLFEVTRPYQIADLTIPAGSISLGYFWPDHLYNVYHWLNPAGHTLGIYCNLSDQTCLTPTEIHWRDLTVDVLITPDGRCQVLNEEELPDELDTKLYIKIAATRDELIQNHRTLLAEIETRSKKWLLHLESRHLLDVDNVNST